MKSYKRKKNKHGLLAAVMAVTMAASMAAAPVSALEDETAPEPDAMVAVQETENVSPAVAEARANVAAAETALAESRQVQAEADDALAQLRETHPDAEKAAGAAESVKAEAESMRDDAQAAYDDAVSAAEEADSAVALAQANSEEAAAALSSALEEQAAAAEELAYQTAAVEAMEAEAAEAEAGADEDPAYVRAVAERDAAKEALEAVIADRDADAEKVAEAQAALQQAVEAEAAVESELADKQSAAEEAQAELDAAQAEKEAAEKALQEAEAAVAASESAYETAKGDTAAKEAEHAAALQAVEDANAAVASADEAIAQAETALSDAQADLEGIKETYDQGYLGFVNWMLAKEDLTDAQRTDLEKAKQALENAMEETFASLGGTRTGMPEEREDMVVALGDEKDAISLDNTAVTFDVMRRINELRAQDDNYVGDMQRNEAYTNFYMMAMAQSAAMRGAGLLDHSYFLPEQNCENLAWGYADPTLGWYNQEKAYFDYFKEELGIEELTSTGVRKISNEAGKYGYIVGHYTNLMYTPGQVMGVGFTDYRNTFSFVGTRSSRYDASALYTIDDFEALFSEYCDSLSVDELRQAVTEAENAVNDANATKEEKQAAVEAAQEAAEAVLTQLEEAKAAEDAAKADITAKQNAVTETRQDVSEAREVVETMLAVLDEANAEVSAAEGAVTAAQNETAIAGSSLEEAQAAQSENDARIAAAEASVAEKQTVVDSFINGIHKLRQAAEEARTGLKEFLDKLTGKKDAATAAEAEKLAAEEALAAAQADAQAKQTALLERQEELAAAQKAVEKAYANSAEAQAALEALNDASAKAEEAAQAVTDAEAKLAEAQSVLAAAIQADAEASSDTKDPSPADETGKTEDPSPADETGNEDDAETDGVYLVSIGEVTWQQGGGGTLDFTVNRGEDDASTFDRFSGVEIDGVLLDPANYTAVSGSLHLSLSAAYLDTLSEGGHSIRFVFDDGTAESSFTILGRDAGGQTPSENGGSADEVSEGATHSGNASVKTASVRHASASPKTGDDTPIGLYIALSVASLLGLVILIRLRKVGER